MPSRRTRFATLVLTLLFLGSFARPARSEGIESLYSLLWMQTSPEYRALCVIVYRTATRQIIDRVQAMRCPRDQQGRRLQVVNVPTPQGVRTVARPLAVVMDLDETVMDGSPLLAYTLRNHRKRDRQLLRLFDQFQAQEARARRTVPGALDFIRKVEGVGISVVYVTNRHEGEESRQAVLTTLRALGVGTRDLGERVLMSGPPETERQKSLDLIRQLGLSEESAEGRALLENHSRKHRRRLEVSQRYQVVGYFGDDLYDFPVYVSTRNSQGAPLTEARQAEMDRNSEHWGTDWFVLPNPAYGSWQPGRAFPEKDMLESLNDCGFGEFVARKKGPTGGSQTEHP